MLYQWFIYVLSVLFVLPCEKNLTTTIDDILSPAGGLGGGSALRTGWQVDSFLFPPPPAAPPPADIAVNLNFLKDFFSGYG